MIAFLGLGSNLDNPTQQLKLAIASLETMSQTTLLKTSSFYYSKPLGPQNQPDFINAVVKIDTGLTPHELLRECQAIETKQGRIRLQHWGPRTIDIDILLYGNEKIVSKDLIIPHPEMKHRDFVLKPLAEITRPFL